MAINFRNIYKYVRHPHEYFLLLKIKKCFFRALNRFHLLNHATIKINNKRIVIPISGEIGLQVLDVNEPWMGKAIEKLSRLKEGSFIDVGVNVGQTLIQLKAYNFDRSYYGFEPSPICYQFVRELVCKNRFQDCELFPVGLSDKDEITTLFSNGLGDTSASIINGFRESDRYSVKINVAVFKGDDLLKRYNLGKICVIKIDVEGAEIEVIRGLNNTIISSRPFILCEILPVYSEYTELGRFRKQRQEEINFFLRMNRYKIFKISVDGNLISFEAFEVHSDLTSCNYLFSPEEDADKLGISFD